MSSNLSLAPLATISGFQAAALVDTESGLTLATEGGGLDLELASAGTTEVLNAKRHVANSLSLGDEVEDILITLGKAYHILRPLERNSKLFLYMVLDRERSNLAMARHTLKDFEQKLDFS